MKKLLLSSFILILSISGFSQAPDMFKYQAVVRDLSGQVIASQLVGVRISILQNSSGGTVVYSETHGPTTSNIGTITLNIGSGTVVSGTFSTIDWGGAIYFLKVEVDPTGGTTYDVVGASQLLSVPYALNAKTVSSIDWTDVQNVPADIADGDDDSDILAGLACANGDVALWNGSSWVCSSIGSGTAGQGSTDAYGSSSFTVLATTTTYTLIPGLTQTINIPANCVVLVSTSGGVQCTAVGVAFAAVDIGIHVDGVASPQAGQQEIVASNTDAVAQMIAYWSMTKTYNLTPGNHTFEVRVKDAGGNADANVSGTNPLIQGVLTVTIINT